MSKGKTRRKRTTLLVSSVAIAVAATIGVVSMMREHPVGADGVQQFTRSGLASPPVVGSMPAEAPAPEATTTAFAPDTTGYDLAALPAVGARAVIAALAVDASPGEPVLPLSATPTASAIPVFTSPGEPPVAQMLREQPYDGTTVPVVEQQEHWLRVLLPARSGLPSQGVVGQQSGWVRAADVTLTVNVYAVSVSLTTGELTVTSAGEPLATLEGLGYGRPDTPTPIGRTYIMTNFTSPALTYTRGLPIVALAVQSGTLDGFSGQDVAVTAFHFHDARDGAISNGCIRVDEATILALSGLPLGTPVMVTE